MYKVIFWGNFNGNSGPAIVNKKLKENLKNGNIIFMDEVNKYSRIKKLTRNFFSSKVIHLSGINGPFSLVIIILGKILGKDIYYTCHGCVALEDFTNNRFSFKERLIEKCYFLFSKKIIIVSNMFKNEIEKMYPRYTKKFYVIHNGFDFNNEIYEKTKNKKNNRIITSLGGGRAEKGNLIVCRELEKIKDKNFEYWIIGEDGPDTNKIKEYKFVKYLGVIENSKVVEFLSKTTLFIQYSVMETFGMAPLEALNTRCDLILSEHMGVIELLSDNSQDIVVKYKDICKLSRIIKRKLDNPKEYKNYKFYTWKDISLEYLKVWGGKYIE